MPVTDAVNTSGSLAIAYPALLAVMGDAAGNAPDRPDLPLTDPPTAGTSTVLTGWEVRRVIQSAGGSKLDFAEFTLGLTTPLENQTQPADFSRAVEVSLPNATADPIFLGDWSSETHALQQGSESLKATAQLRGYHFGKVCSGQLWRNPLDSTDTPTAHAPVFNPTIDGQRLPNRSDQKRLDGKDAYVWIHPEAARTGRAQTYSGQAPANWDLLEAILAMCWLLNEDEDYVTNPTRAELTAALADAAYDIVDNLRLPSGKNLPFYLDALLEPHGFNWLVDYTLNGGTTERKLSFFKRGSGTQKELYLQAAGSVLSLSDPVASSNVNNFEITRDIGESINRTVIRGALQVREVTMELHRAWAEADDSLTAAQLDSSDPASSYTGNEKVWRMWAANEAGDLTGLRTTTHPAGNPPDLSTVFTTWIPHRRTMGDCLSHWGGSESEERQPPLVEWSADAGTTWKQVPAEWGDVLLLPDQIGVMFNNKGEPPGDLIAAGDDARVRITGTITGDAAITFVAGKQAHAVNGREVTLHKELGSKFVDAAVQTTGTFASAIASGGGDSGQNHLIEIQTFAEQLRDEYEAAELTCSCRLPGWHHGAYAIGDLLTNIAGREISLDRASPTAPAPKYPQITEIEYGIDGQGPYTILRVDRNAV